MTEKTVVEAPIRSGWSVDLFAAFWSNPDPSLVRYGVTEDVVGNWPGDSEPVQGVDAYTARIAQVLERVPDLRLEVAEHAQHRDLAFIRWIARGTGGEGRAVELTGFDRVRLRDGLVAENIIRYDPAEFERLLD